MRGDQNGRKTIHARVNERLPILSLLPYGEEGEEEEGSPRPETKSPHNDGRVSNGLKQTLAETTSEQRTTMADWPGPSAMTGTKKEVHPL